MTVLFRSSISDRLPESVKTKLEDVVGINLMNQAKFSDHVMHVVERYRKSELKAKEQAKEILRTGDWNSIT